MENSLSNVKRKYVKKHTLWEVCQSYNKLCKVALSKRSCSYNSMFLETKMALYSYIYQFVQFGLVIENDDGTFFVQSEYRNMSYSLLSSVLEGNNMKQSDSERLANINAKKVLNVQVKKKTQINFDDVKSLGKSNTSNVISSKITKEQDAPPSTKPLQKVRENMDASKVPTTFDIAVASRYRTIVFRAKEKGIEVDLTIKQLSRIMKATHCAYTGVEFSDDSESENYLTIDRIDHTKGYTKNNVVACTARANSLKSNLFESADSLFSSVDEMKLFCSSLSKLSEK